MIKFTTKFKETETGSIPEKWNIVNLGETVEIIDGDRGTNYPSGDDFSTGGYCLFLNTKNVPGNNFDFSSLQFISRGKDESLGKGKLKRGDFVLTTRGTVGNIAFYDSNVSFENIRINSGMVILRNDETRNYFNSQYLYQILKSRRIKNQLERLITGSAQPQLPIRDLKNLKLIMSPISEQEKISEILVSLDDKIELLRKQNETLEKISQTIFKEWFVNFRFPRCEKVKMIDSELGKIPEGWKVGRLIDSGNIACGKTPPKDIKEYFGGNIPFIKIPDMHNQMFILQTEDSLSEEGASTQKNKYLPKNSICVSCIATVGLVSITTTDSQANQQINSVIPKDEILLEYLFFVLKRMKEFLNTAGSGGTATLNINTTIFSAFDILYPDREALKQFHEVVNPLFSKILQNNIQIQTLSRLRDTLLPKLMNGEIKV